MIHRGVLPSPIIMVHGYFSSNKIGPHRLYYQIAEALNRVGYTVFRTDLSGMGESDGNIESIRFADHSSDLQAIVRHVLHRDDLCRSGCVHLIGHCIGCCTALDVARIFPDNLESITLLSPFIPSKENHIKMLGDKNYEKIMETGYGYRKGAYCCRSFICAAYILTNMVTTNLLRTVRTNIIFSQKDEFSDIDDSIGWSNSIPLSSHIIDNANHNYIGSVVRTNLIELLLDIFQRNSCEGGVT